MVLKSSIVLFTLCCLAACSNPPAATPLDTTGQDDVREVDAEVDVTAEDATADATAGDTSTGPDDAVVGDEDAEPDAQADAQGDDATGPADTATPLEDAGETTDTHDSDADPSEACPSGQRCEAGWCITGRGDEQCVRNSDCPGIATCLPELAGGLCQGCGTDADCPNTAECTEVQATCAESCTSAADCPYGRCVGGFCRPRTCATDADCPEATRCGATGLCSRIPCTDPCMPNPCTSDNQGVCVDEGTAFRCDCNPGYRPADGGAGCVPDIADTCPFGFVCQSERCVERAAPLFQCGVDSDCGGGRACSAALPSGQCPCTTTADCPAAYNNICLAQRCLSACATAADCHPGMACNAGFCGQRVCESDGDCPANYGCDALANPKRCVRLRCE